MGSSLIFDPVYINVSVPGKAIKKPKTAEVPTASWIFFENIVKVGTLKLPPPIPIVEDKKPIEELIAKLIMLDDGISLLTIIGLCWNSIFNEIKNASITKRITKLCPEIELAAIEPAIDPVIIPIAHFFTIINFVFLSLTWDLMEEIEVKQITPRDDATATCMTISVL